MKKKGKNFSGNTGTVKGTRNKSDFYQTPYSMTEQLLENEKFDYNKTILDPACGDGAIARILDKYFKYTKYSDINYNNSFDMEYHDFINIDSFYIFDYIICNPPYSLAFEFIQKAKEIAKEKFAMLLPLNYLHSQKRYEAKLFTDPEYPLTKIYVFTRYPLLTDSVREDGKYNTGMMVYMWAIWENIQYKLSKIPDDQYGSCSPFPIIKWIDNNKYVLRKEKKNEKNSR